MRNLTEEEWKLHLISQCECHADVYEMWADDGYRREVYRAELERKLEELHHL